VISRADCRAISALYHCQHSFMYWPCSKQNCLLCAYECDFGDNDKITIVKTGLTTKKYVAVLSVLNLVSDFVECNCPIDHLLFSIEHTCAINIAAMASYSAVPSMLMVAPMGRTNRATLGSTPFFSSRLSMVTGRVAAEEAVPNAVVSALPMLPIKRKGRLRVASAVKYYVPTVLSFKSQTPLTVY
jgi:hypothetical protein